MKLTHAALTLLVNDLMQLIKLFFFLIILCSLKTSHQINNANHCKLTKESMNNYEPEKFNPTNNLLKSEGDYTFSKADKITIKGIVRDNFCIPVQDAKIYLWQTNEKGKYVYKILREKFDDKGEEYNPNEKFQGSGVATTDNNGEFTFTTIFPGTHDKEHANLNLRIEHRVLGILQTKVYLKKHNIKTKTEKIDLEFNLAKENLIPTKEEKAELISDDFIENLEEEISAKHGKVQLYKIIPGYDLAFPDSKNNYKIEIVISSKKNYRRF
jgi:protocatechuate 3,4-dioxygenase beta subunit